MSHYVVTCKICGGIISQCRCPSSEKPVTYDVCDNCKKRENPDAPQDNTKDR